MKHRKKPRFSDFSKIASLIIYIGMPIITFVFIYILQMLITVPENERAWLYANAYTMLEYAIMSFTLVFCGAFLCDTAIKYDNKRN